MYLNGGESPQLVSTPTGAVFLSYASHDVEAAKRICDALRRRDPDLEYVRVDPFLDPLRHEPHFQAV